MELGSVEKSTSQPGATRCVTKPLNCAAVPAESPVSSMPMAISAPSGLFRIEYIRSNASGAKGWFAAVQMMVFTISRPGQTIGTRFAAIAAGEITSTSNGTCQRSVSRILGGLLVGSPPLITNPSNPLSMDLLQRST